MLELLKKNKVFDGWHEQYTHASQTLNCKMRFSIYLPPQADAQQPVPVLYWLSGLTCTDENFMQKAGVFQAAAKHGIAVVAPDTSPRGDDVADDDGYDLGKGAGFYVDAVEPPWKEHYQMYSYITKELSMLIESSFPVSDVRSISGHSMGGHGALTIGLKNQDVYRSISAFSPICNPINCPWGKKAFTAYLGEETNIWKQYDACEIIKHTKVTRPVLVDQGTQDEFLLEQLHPEALEQVATAQGADITIRYQPDYDHSYFFIASFISEHIKFHAQNMAITDVQVTLNPVL